jgi:hypothetical protein
MALAQPNIGAVNPLPSFTQDRGSSIFDPITKSTKQDPSVFTKEDTCGRDTYVAFSQSISINENIDCTPTLAASITLAGLVPLYSDRDANGEGATLTTPAEFEAALDAVYANLKISLLSEFSLVVLQPDT